MPSLTVIVPNVWGIAPACRSACSARRAKRSSPALHGLEETRSRPERRRRQEAERAREDSGLIAEDVAEHVLRQHDVERRRIGDQPHGGGIDVAVLEPYLGVVARDPRDRLAP